MWTELKPKLQMVTTRIDVKYTFRLPNVLMMEMRRRPATKDEMLVRTVTKLALIGVPRA